MASRKSVWSNLLKATGDFFSDRFDLDDDRANDFETIEYIKKGVEFRGTNLWILMFAIMVASVGLNLDSTAVVIGAMLISPLMGPIMGVGLGMGINDFNLILRSLKNLAIAVVISILVSALYFTLSPLNEAKSELLSRTEPAIWDVLIGFFGGLAGIVAGSRQEKSNAIPGVAIATALMPPLCTAGYAIAIGSLEFFFGAFYLFVINSVFISIATWLIVRYLKYPKKEFLDEKTERRTRFYILGFTLLIIIPSILTAFGIVRESVFQSRAEQFVNVEFDLKGTRVVSEEFIYTGDTNIIDVFLMGEIVEDDVIAQIENKLDAYRLYNSDLIIHQSKNQGLSDDYLTHIEATTQKYTTGIIQELYQKNEEAIANKEKQIELLEQKVIDLTAKSFPVVDIVEEVKTINDAIKSLSISQAVQVRSDSAHQLDTVDIAVVEFEKVQSRGKIQELENFLKVRTKSDNIKVILIQ